MLSSTGAEGVRKNSFLNETTQDLAMSSASNGWYPDPGNDQQLRWWEDGAWSEKVKEKPKPDLSVLPLEESDITNAEPSWSNVPDVHTERDGVQEVLQYSPLTKLHRQPYLSAAEMFWYVFSCVPLAGGYIAKVPLKKALEESGIVVRARAERVWYVLLCVFFGYGYFAKLPMKKALAEAGFLGQTTMARFWYGVQCAFFGAGYIAKVPVKKALEDTGLVTRTTAERVWYVLLCIDFGSGYLGKIPAAKALSEAEWQPDGGYIEPLPRKKWWYWAIAVLVIGGYYTWVGPRVVESFSFTGGPSVVQQEYITAWDTFVVENSKANTLAKSGVGSEEVAGVTQEIQLLDAFSTSVRSINFPSSDQGGVTTLTTDAQLVSANLQNLLSNIHSQSAINQIEPEVLTSFNTFVQAAANLGVSINVTGIS